MTKSLVLDALRAAYWRKKPPPGLLHHSDRGSQYCSGIYRNLQVTYKMKTSMALALDHPVSRKGDCWDNAPMESFFGTLKTECLHHFKLKTRDQARQVVFEYIEVFYNRIRRHANHTKPGTRRLRKPALQKRITNCCIIKQLARPLKRT